jgi:cytochrome b6-f complex iron-sulfur subunit
VLATLADIPVGTAIAAKDPSGQPIVVARPTAGTAVAFSAICTHMGCTVAPAGAQLACPCHGSRYNASTGAVLQGPAPKPLASVPVHVEEGKVVGGSA